MKLSENYCLSLTQRNMLLKRYHCHNAQKLLEPPKWSWQICYQYYIYFFMNIKQKCFAIQLFRAFFSIFWLLENWTVILNASNLPSFCLANEKFITPVLRWSWTIPLKIIILLFWYGWGMRLELFSHVSDHQNKFYKKEPSLAQN